MALSARGLGIYSGSIPESHCSFDRRDWGTRNLGPVRPLPHRRWQRRTSGTRAAVFPFAAADGGALVTAQRPLPTPQPLAFLIFQKVSLVWLRHLRKSCPSERIAALSKSVGSEDSPCINATNDSLARDLSSTVVTMFIMKSQKHTRSRECYKKRPCTYRSAFAVFTSSH